MSDLRVSLFGKVNVRCGDHPLVGLEQHRVQELLCYLLLFRDRPHPREMLAGVLWGNNPTPQSKKYLRQALWQLNTGLETQLGAVSRRILEVEPDWINLNSNDHLWLDVAEFERAYTSVQGATGQDLDSQKAQTLQAAVRLYGGELLEGYYQDWCVYERERLQNMHLAILDKLMNYCEAHRLYEDGLFYGACVLRYDRARERTHRRMMR